MKNNLILVIFLLLASSQVQALTDFEISGELDVTASFVNLPTGQRGTSAFNVPTFFLDFKTPLKENNFFNIQFDGSEEKVNSTERFSTQVRKAYIDVISILPAGHGLRLGLIPQPWQELQYEVWSYRFLGRDAWAMTEKWKYLQYSDLGFSIMSEFPEDIGEWFFTFTNGEGVGQKETGSQKDVSFLARFPLGSPWTFSVNYVRGNYGQYAEKISLKERIQGLLIYQLEDTMTWGLEYLATQDPADAIKNQNIAESVDVDALLGHSVRGQGASLYTVISAGPKSEVMIRYDYLNAVTSLAGKDLQTYLLSYGYQISEDIKAALIADYTKYGSDFGLGVRDRSKIELAVQVLF